MKYKLLWIQQSCETAQSWKGERREIQGHPILCLRTKHCMYSVSFMCVHIVHYIYVYASS